MSNSRVALKSNPAPQQTLITFFSRILSLEVNDINCGWKDILIPQGLIECAEAFENDSFLAWVIRWAEYHLGVSPAEDTDCIYAHLCKRGLVLNDYCGNWGAPLVLARLYEKHQESSYLEAIEATCNAIIHQSIRIRDNVIAHGGFAKTSVWVDTLYYSASPLAMAYRLTQNKVYAEESLQQCLLHSRFLRDKATGCFFHDTDPETNQRTASFWSRGNGWILMALADTLREIPDSIPEWHKVQRIYQSLCVGLLRYQHPSGMWRIVPELESSHQETSGTAMILTGLTIGVNEGWLEQSLITQILRGYRELETWIHPKSGALMGSQKAAGCGGWETHKCVALDECTYASGIFMRLVAELKIFHNKSGIPFASTLDNEGLLKF